jgi:hypothetical protein
MKHFKFEAMLGVIFLGLFLGLCFWQSPSLWRAKLTKEELSGFLSTIEKQVQQPDKEKQEFLARLRVWCEADDGKPVYMLNLMRYYEQLHRFPGSPDFTGSPEQCNAFYEKSVAPLLLKRGGYPLVGGPAQGKNLVGFELTADDWSRVLIVRYPSRRAFLSLLADPAYGPFVPYKLMAVKLTLVPISGELVIPDVKLAVGGGLLVLFLTIGWIRAARRKPGGEQA